MVGENRAIEDLNRLLEVPRSQEKERLVDEVLALNAEPADKALRIVMIDLLPEVPTPTESPSKKHGALVRDRERESEVLEQHRPASTSRDEVRQLERTRRNVVKHPRKGGLWAFFFSEARKIRGFGVQTGTVVPGLLPFRLQISLAAQSFLSQTLRTVVIPTLEQMLPMVLDQGWRTLTKFEYNLMVAVNDLVNRVKEVGPYAVGRQPKNAWDEVIAASAVFWVAPNLQIAAVKTWDLVSRRLGFSKRLRSLGSQGIKVLIESIPGQITLPVVLRVMQMLRFRRAIAMSEMVNTEHNLYFSRKVFDCSPEVQSEIGKEVAQISAELAALGRQLRDCRRSKYFLPEGTLLEDFVHSADLSDRIVWTRIFLGTLSEKLAPLLTESVTLAPGRRTILLTNSPLSASFQRLRSIFVQLNDPTESRKNELVFTTAQLLLNAGWHLADLLEVPAEKNGPAQTLSSNVGPSGSILHQQETVETPNEFAGMTVVEALTKAARILLLAGTFLGNEVLESQVDQEPILLVNISEHLARYERLADESDWLTIKAEFSLIV